MAEVEEARPKDYQEETWKYLMEEWSGLLAAGSRKKQEMLEEAVGEEQVPEPEAMEE